MRIHLTTDLAEAGAPARLRILPSLGLAAMLFLGLAASPAQAATEITISYVDHTVSDLFFGTAGFTSFHLDGHSGTATLESGVAKDLGVIQLTETYGRDTGATLSKGVSSGLVITSPTGSAGASFSQVWQVTDDFSWISTLSDGGTATYVLPEGTITVDMAGAFGSSNSGDPSPCNTCYLATVLFTSNDVAGGVPEPSAWALMIGGFGLTGAALRRRRARVAA
jgi:hypothetical protein